MWLELVAICSYIFHLGIADADVSCSLRLLYFFIDYSVCNGLFLFDTVRQNIDEKIVWRGAYTNLRKE